MLKFRGAFNLPREVVLKFRKIEITGNLLWKTKQGRIQDFEMGGENIKKNSKNQILFQYLKDKKKKKERRGFRKKEGVGGGGENSPISPPLDPRLLRSTKGPYSLHVCVVLDNY